MTLLLVLLVAAHAAERYTCADLLADPASYADNHLVRHWVTRASDHRLAVETIRLDDLILLVAYQEHRGVFWFEGDHYGRLDDIRERLSGSAAPLSADRYAWLLDQNKETSAWIRRKLNFVIGLSPRPSMKATLRDLGDEAWQAGLPFRLTLVPCSERWAIDGEQLSLL